MFAELDVNIRHIELNSACWCLLVTIGRIFICLRLIPPLLKPNERPASHHRYARTAPFQRTPDSSSLHPNARPPSALANNGRSGRLRSSIFELRFISLVSQCAAFGSISSQLHATAGTHN